MTKTNRIAMWSGPRNLSTAMMYSFGARQDCDVVDEPFYAAYLALTGLIHPMGDAVLDSQPKDPKDVITALLEPITPAVQYQKHMTQHMVDGVPRDWIKDVRNVFLIRHPARVIASYAKKREGPSLDDIGFRQQAELYDLVVASGQSPVVIDSADIRGAPEQKMKQLCAALGLDWDPNMLQWPAGGHVSDGVWAQHWYGAVHASTGFSGAEGPLPDLPPEYQSLMTEALSYYERLAAVKL
jgi:hypothetical protein